MKITAKNKMGAAQVVEQNYASELEQTINFRLSDPEWLKSNLNATQSFLQAIGRPATVDNGTFTWVNIPVAEVMQFLNTYQADPAAESFDLHTIREYIQTKSRGGELIQWHVSVRGSRTDAVGLVNLGIDGHPGIGTISRTRLRHSMSSIGSLINPATKTKDGDEMVGLSAPQIAAAKATEGEDSFGYRLRSERDPREGLLLIYPISKDSQPSLAHQQTRVPLFSGMPEAVDVIGIALVFPPSTRNDTVQYIANRVGSQ
jgi:hypothetical protein